MFRHHFLNILVVVFTVFTAFAQRANGAGPVAQAEETTIADAKIYAAAMKVSLDEAALRLHLQDQVGDLDRQLATNESTTFAGLWIEHQPHFRVIARFVRDGEGTIQRYAMNTSLASYIKIRTATVTLKELEAARGQTAKIALALGVPANSGINVFENRAELYVLDQMRFDNALEEARLQLPSSVKVIVVDELPKEVADIYGGRPLTTCTSGFSVEYYGSRGVTTAGHCSDSQSYQGSSLPYMWGTPGGAVDIQWHSAPNFTVRNMIWDGIYFRYIYSTKWRSSQAVGEWVCKYGMTTGQGCGSIVDKAFDGVNVRVSNVNVQGGDSGGPWFRQNTAYGTTISQLGSDAIYGPVDHIYNALSVSILTQ